MTDVVDPQGAASALVKLALSAGAQAAEAYALDVRTTTLLAEGPYLRPSEIRFEGIGLRVVVEARVGLAGQQGLRDPGALVQSALRAAREAGAPERGGFAPALRSPLPTIADPTIVAGDEARLSDFVERASAHLRARTDVTYARIDAKDAVRRIAITNSNGLDVAHTSTSERIEVEARVTRGTTERTATESWTGCVASDARPEALAAAAVADARRALDSAPLASPVTRVVLAGVAASQIVGIASSAFSGVGVQAGKSSWERKLGERVASEALTIADDPRAVAGRSRLAIDDEGTPTRRVTLIERGELRSFLHTRASASDAGCEPTGSASRKSVDAGLNARPVNLIVEPGDVPLDALIEAEERAVLVTQPLLGSFVASRVTGDVSLVAPFAYYVEGGKIRHALPPTTVGGNVHRMLASVDEVANDRRAFLAGCVPSLRLGDVSCAT